MFVKDPDTEICYQSLAEALELDKGREGQVIAIVGAGGKTTTAFALAKELTASEKHPARGRKVLVTTTTHMYREDPHGFFYEEGMVLPWEEHPYLQLGVDAKLPEAPDKIRGLPDEVRRSLERECFATIIEADGAKGMQFKVPRENEPVIPDETDVILIMGSVAVLGRELEQVVFNWRGLCTLLGSDSFRRLREEDLAIGLMKGYGQMLRVRYPRAKRVYLINRCDNPYWDEKGEMIAAMLDGPALLTSHAREVF